MVIDKIDMAENSYKWTSWLLDSNPGNVLRSLFVDFAEILYQTEQVGVSTKVVDFLVQSESRSW